MSAAKPHLLLIGAGPTHLYTFARWLEQRPKDLTLTLLSPQIAPICGYRVADWVAGHIPLEACRMPLEATLQSLGVQWISGRCTGLDANRRLVRHNNSSFGDLSYDVVSIDVGTSGDAHSLEDLLPGARGRVLPMRPLESFVQLWPQVETLAGQRTVHLAVVGGHAATIEMALAVEAKMRRLGASSSVTVVTGRDGLLPGANPRLQKHMQRLLAQRGIHCIAQRCVAIDDGQIYLDTGLRLQCDLPLIATPHQPAPWFKHSGATLNEQGFLTTNGHGQSTSHPELFVSAYSLGESPIGEKPLRDTLSVHGATLAHNLVAILKQQPLVLPPTTPQAGVWIGTGDRRLVSHAGKVWGLSGLRWWQQQRALGRFAKRLAQPIANQARA